MTQNRAGSRASAGNTSRRGIAAREGFLHYRGQFRLLQLGAGLSPGLAQRGAGNAQHAALGDARPEQLRGGPDLGGEDDTEPGDGGFELGPGAVLEGELALEGSCHAGREQRLLVRLGQRPECVVKASSSSSLFQPVEGKDPSGRPTRLSPGLSWAKVSSFMRSVGRSGVSRMVISSASA